MAVIKARILSAHDKGTHAEVVVKVKKILKSGKVKIARSNRSIYPESWTNRGCTCPILNPGKDKMLVTLILWGHTQVFITCIYLHCCKSGITPWKEESHVVWVIEIKTNCGKAVPGNIKQSKPISFCGPLRKLPAVRHSSFKHSKPNHASLWWVC